MYQTKNEILESIREKSVALLNARLVDCIDLQSQIKQAHWNVKGSNFIALHRLFDEIYEAVGGYVDSIAERAVQLGGVAEGTVRTAATRSTLKEYPLMISSETSHTEAVSTVLAAFGQLARKAIEEATEDGDLDTADLFTGISRGIDMWLWFVEAHLR